MVTPSNKHQMNTFSLAIMVLVCELKKDEIMGILLAKCQQTANIEEFIRKDFFMKGEPCM